VSNHWAFLLGEAMSALFREYKPFRNYLSQFDLLSSLEAIWCYSVHISEDRPLPLGFVVGAPALDSIKKYIHPWDLDTLAREIILNARSSGHRSLQNWRDLARAINYLRHLDGVAFEQGNGGKPDVIFELHRIAHRQFPWQVARGVNPVMRALKVFGSDTVEAIANTALGMSARQMFTLGMAVGGHFLKRPYLSTAQDYSSIGIPGHGTKLFFDRITIPIDELRLETKKLQSYDEDWLYMWNPLEATPLIRFDEENPDRVICPIPRYLLRRASSGMFYDLVKSEDFANRFGDAFQKYVGDLIHATCPSPPFSVSEETPYLVKGQTCHGVDWILSDASGHLFIETKAKRLTVSARTLSDTTALDRDLRAMAQAITQHYKNIRDATDGKTHWKNDGLLIFPLILTLEDWFLLSPRIGEMLNRHLLHFLAEANIDAAVLEEIPYTIASVHEFELAVQVISQIGIGVVMEEKTKAIHRTWGLSGVLSNSFKSQMQNASGQIFGSDLQDLLAEVKTSTA
jgi:hypothetical protein